ncbi:integrase catalytic domain-containing protein [Trichonephila clavipes]|nr:integrase catalytic domain-containing protein [Trichonephila clavipes]
MLNTFLYVDDLFAGSSESVNKAFDLSKNAIEILKDANMNLRKFKTNSKELRKLWNENGIGEVGDSDGLICVGGRLQKSKFSYLQKHPIILPAKHYFANLIVRGSHEEVFHGGISETLLENRERFWPIKGRQTGKNILKKCVLCKRFSSTSGVQVTSPLPALRVEQSAPFSVVEIDFGGPLHTKDENKHYIVLFTWAVTRALHLELVNNLTTETFRLALRRFINRRGLCSKILTDNAKTFKRSELELKNL